MKEIIIKIKKGSAAEKQLRQWQAQKDAFRIAVSSGKILEYMAQTTEKIVTPLPGI